MSWLNELERGLRDGAAGVGAGAPLPELTEPARRAGLLDLAYAVHDSPVGPLLLASTPRGLVRVSYLEGDDPGPALERLAAELSPRILAAPRQLDPVRRELEEYFAGLRRRFDVELDWQLARGFARRVLEATAEIPYGALASYREVATAAGSPRAVRAAGNALGANPLPIVVPCHRIVRTGGGIGGYTGGLERKRTLLALEAGGRA